MSFERAYFACDAGSCPNCMQALEEERNYNAIRGDHSFYSMVDLANEALKICFECRKENKGGRAVMKLLEERLPERFEPQKRKEAQK